MIIENLWLQIKLSAENTLDIKTIQELFTVVPSPCMVINIYHNLPLLCDRKIWVLRRDQIFLRIEKIPSKLWIGWISVSTTPQWLEYVTKNHEKIDGTERKLIWKKWKEQTVTYEIFYPGIATRRVIHSWIKTELWIFIVR